VRAPPPGDFGIGLDLRLRLHASHRAVVAHEGRRSDDSTRHYRTIAATPLPARPASACGGNQPANNAQPRRSLGTVGAEQKHITSRYAVRRLPPFNQD
jgi:hypothetical protein